MSSYSDAPEARKMSRKRPEYPKLMVDLNNGSGWHEQAHDATSEAALRERGYIAVSERDKVKEGDEE